MNKIKISIIALSLVLSFASCKNNKQTNNTVQISDSSFVADSNKNNIETDLSVEFSSKYICPNHCKGSGSENIGKCPVCGMEYIENPDFEQ